MTKAAVGAQRRDKKWAWRWDGHPEVFPEEMTPELIYEGGVKLME